MYTKWQHKPHLYLHTVRQKEGKRDGWGKVQYTSFKHFLLLNKWINATQSVFLFMAKQSMPALFVSLILDKREGGSRLHSCCRHCCFFSIYLLFFWGGVQYFQPPSVFFFFFFFVNHTGLYHNYIHTLVSSLASVKEVADKQVTYTQAFIHSHSHTYTQKIHMLRPLPHSTAMPSRRHNSWTSFVDQSNNDGKEWLGENSSGKRELVKMEEGEADYVLRKEIKKPGGRYFIKIEEV